MPHYILDARTATNHFPGIGRYVRNLAPALAAQLTPEERLSILWNPADLTAWNPSDLTGAQIDAVPAPISPFSLRQQWTLPGLLRQVARQTGVRTSRWKAHSLYHSTYYLMPYWPGMTTVLTIYDLIAMLHPEAVSLQARLLFRLTTALALRTARHVIAISQATRQDLLTHFGVAAEQVSAIPLAADPRFQPQPPDEIQRRRVKYDLPEEYLLYLGINKPHKNLPTLIHAYARLAGAMESSLPPLVIAGAWDERYPQVKQQVQKLGLENTVRFLGLVDDADLPALYSGCALFVFPSLYEGFGLPVLEAMACGAPVLCGNRSSLPEVAGSAALLVDPANVDAMASAIQKALDESTRRILSQRSLVQAATFSWQRTATETLAVYRQAMREQ